MLPKDSKMCHYQYQKLVLVLVDFQNKASIKYKLLVYILGILSRVAIWNRDY